MAKRKTLKDQAGNIVYPTTRADVVFRADRTTTVEQALNNVPRINVTSTDPGEGSATTANTFTAVVGSASGLIDLFYPVGSIYMSASLDTPAKVMAAFGGTWVAWGSGRVPVGVDTTQTEFNTVGKTGGGKNGSIDLSNEIRYAGVYSFMGGPGAYSDKSIVAYQPNPYPEGGVGPFTPLANVSHTTLQPYITCYMYKRTA